MNYSTEGIQSVPTAYRDLLDVPTTVHREIYTMKNGRTVILTDYPTDKRFHNLEIHDFGEYQKRRANKDRLVTEEQQIANRSAYHNWLEFEGYIND